jgi:hypothetical protein
MKIEDPYKEALRYIDNAKDDLKLAGKDGKFYDDLKYVKSACGIAYSGILVALDALFDVKDLPKRRGRKAIEYYQSNLGKLNKKLLNNLNNAYTILHLDGYYGGINDIKAIEAGFENAISIIESIKPFYTNGVSK